MKEITWIKDPVTDILDTTTNAVCKGYCGIKYCGYFCNTYCDVYG